MLSLAEVSKSVAGHELAEVATLSCLHLELGRQRFDTNHENICVCCGVSFTAETVAKGGQ